MELNLENLGINELIKDEIEKVINNINDINCDKSTKRSITITIDILPRKHNQIMITPKIKSSLASIETDTLQFYYDKLNRIYENDPEQLEFPVENVKQLKKES